jgi:hypothetical protein
LFQHPLVKVSCPIPASSNSLFQSAVSLFQHLLVKVSYPIPTSSNSPFQSAFSWLQHLQQGVSFEVIFRLELAYWLLLSSIRNVSLACS